MKKSTIFIIAVIYLLSIYVVTLFGMKIKVDQFEILMEKIEITTYDEKDIKGIKTKNIVFDENVEYTSFQLDYTYSPTNATHPDQVKFIISGNIKKKNGEEVTIASVTSFGKVIFTNPGTVTVKILVSDGSGVNDTIRISCNAKS